MKIAAVLVFILSVHSFASSYGQTIKMNISIENATFKEIIERLEKESGYYVVIKYDQTLLDKKFDADFKNATVSEILDILLKDTGLGYKFIDKYIAISTISELKSANQQQKTVTGKITDSSGTSLPGVSIVVKGTTTGTITDANGFYSLSNIPEKSILQYSFVGMKSQDVAVGTKTTINVTLAEDAIGIEEVVAIGYGTQRRASVTGSIATINSDKLTISPVASTTNALTGRMPGLITKQVRGLPGSDAATLSIRGFDAPLVIVDGVEASFNNIDANEIESISVLKDAAAAIYGSRAGNGVVLITTRRGILNKPTFVLNSTMTFQGATYLPGLTSSGEDAELIREAHLNSGKPESTARFTQHEVDLFYAGTDPDYPNTDWANIVLRDWSPQQQHNLSVTGGSDKIKYYGFFGYLDQQSMFKTNGGDYKRYNVRSNIDAKISDNFNVQFDLSSIVENRDFPWRADEQANSVWQEYWTTEPFWAPTLPDATKIPAEGAGGAVGLGVITNSAISGYRKTDNQDIKGSIALNYTFKHVKGLSARAFANYDQSYQFYKMWDWLVDSWSYNYASKTYTQRSTQSNRGLTYQDNRNRMMTGQLSLSYDRTFLEDHHLTVMALYEVIDYKSNYINAFRDGQKTFAIDYAFAGSLSNQKVNDGASQMGRQSFVGRLNYAYKSKYLLDGTLRFDQSAKFNPAERTGIFPSVSLGWRLSEENFMKSALPSLENLKLRASISQTGNDAVGNFQYLSGYKYGDSYIIGSKASIGMIASGLANPFLTWETMTIYNTGLDFALSKRKLYGELDLFYRNRDGIPGTRSVSLPTTFGATLPTENLNTINTRGFELILGNEGEWRDLRWDISANVSWSRSKWGFYDEPVYADPDQDRQSRRTGQWTDRAFGYISDGLFTTQAEIDALTYKYNETQGNVSIKPGDIRFKDMNSDGLLNWKDQVEIGKGTMPHWMGGLNVKLNYKGFDLTALLQGAVGFNQTLALFPGSVYSQLVYDNRWTPTNNNRNGLIPRLGGAATNSWASDFWNKNSNYIRLKTFSVGYSLPSSIIKKVNMQNLRLYVAGTNLFTISGLNKYDADPEGMSGWTAYYYPQMRTFTFGLNVSF